jgi:mannose-6-phosphate isomerase-like protein (cupin superfamily)
LQPRLSYEPHRHEDHEEVYYIINGTGRIKIGNEDKYNSNKYLNYKAG